MRLFEAIIEANHRAVAGDQNAGLRPAEHSDSLPVVALTCIDERLNPLIPEVLGIPEEEFIWVRNAGNIISGPFSSTMRSLAVGSTIRGAKEIAIIGHTDCLMGKITMARVLDRLTAAGVPRQMLPDNIVEYFGVFSSERQNIIKGCDIVRHSPLISAKVPVQGLLVDIQTGRLEWLVNGYQTFATMGDKWNEVVRSAGETVDKLKSLTDFNIGEMKFPETKIGETVTKVGGWMSQQIGQLEVKPTQGETSASTLGAAPSAVNVARKVVELAEKHWPQPVSPAQQPTVSAPPPKIPLPPPIRLRPKFPPRPKR